MSITISQPAFWELFAETEEISNQCADELETICKYPQELGQGHLRYIHLREGLDLTIADYQLNDYLILKSPERKHSLEFTFYLSGGHKNQSSSAFAGQYAICGSGIAPKESYEWLANQRTLAINLHIEPEFFCSCLDLGSGQKSAQLAHLVGIPEQKFYVRSGNTTSVITVVLQQILQFPYQGITKRIYLESKALELITLLVAEELALGQSKINTYYLKPDDIDRIHRAKDILLQNIDNPPSLIELARMVGLNDCTLKRGFRQVFNTTAFGYLHQQRLEKAGQLLAVGEMSIGEVARAIGFADRSYFAAAFRRKYGVNPSLYLKSHQEQIKNSA
ncbi:helix-turn-helix transcriptional regulator [Komarekiella sp. 'clone 1']|uniref:Helix-turn-helix transcriptional regulator n=1 Tax=Komarekiella delphini-convector SJRDD-AB1 TaxID=2593771 RepID=A0AA40VSB0_9NOST|nr:AraC family transcriptional regulator [Komarekiella delphini-convector]MBD6617807.1 helix-turn-helix transcriptional regulator [Komarekiella delphini-convector SJRDD-AB1]